jgi:UDP-N-acetylglucosamine acyltransferase
MPTIHPSAVVDPKAEIAPDVEIGPFCHVDASSGLVRLAAGVRLVSHVHLSGPIEVGTGTTLYPHVALGQLPQDFKFTRGMPTAGVRVGSGCLIREGVTLHAATKPDVPTTVGDRVLMMVNSHAGHDAHIGNDCILANGSMLGGHARVGDKANISGNVAIHQFNRVGRLAFVSGGSAVSTDVPPFCVAWGRNRLHGVNLVGMRRNGFPREHIDKVKWAFIKVFRASLPRGEMLQVLDELAVDCPPVGEMAQFVREAKKPICAGLGRPSRDLVALWRAVKSGKLALTAEDEPVV